ncbi:MAG TPA: hypothetical protein PLH61_10150, partial [Bacteroidia bacterium]|nr:hypothetical protein [Bacteroidia bacterium]
MKKLLLIALFVLPKMLFAQWQECSTPYHGTILQLASFDGYIWAGTEIGGVYRTTNQQANWEVQNNGLSAGMNRQVNRLKVINGELYLGCRGGLFKRSSANANWVQLADYFYPASDVCGVGGNILLYGTYGSMRRSTDGGLTWQDSNTGLPAGGFDVRVMENDLTTGEIIISLGGVGLYHSTNLGLSWSPINYPGGLSPSSNFITMLKMVNNTMYAGLEPQGLFSWNTITGNWQMIAQASARITDMIFVNNKYLITSSYGIQMFPQFGSGMFNYINATTPGFLSGTYCLEQSGSVIYSGGMNEGAYIIDTSLMAYSNKIDGMKSSSISLLEGDGTHLLTQAANQHFTYSSNDEFTTATPIFDVEPYYINDNYLDASLDNTKWYMIRNARGVNVSYDHGQTVIKANNGLPATINQTYFLMSICKSNAGYMILGTREGKFYKTTNDTTWVPLSDLFSPNESIDKIINAGNYLFAGTRNVLNPSSAHVYRSADNGQTWQIMPGPFQNGMSVYGLTFDGVRLIAGASGYGTWYSTDYGLTWTSVTSGLPLYNYFRDIKSYNGSAYGISELNKNLYRLLSGDTTWICLNCSAGDPKANDVFYQNNTLFLGSVDYGIYKWPNYTTGLAEQEDLASSLYPNPSKNCQIDLTNDYALPLSVKVYDLQGKTVYSE